MLPLQNVPVLTFDLGPQPWRALELEPKQVAALGGNDEESGLLLPQRNAASAVEDRLADHRRPFDLEEEREVAAHVPDHVDCAERIPGRANDERQVDPPLLIGQPIGQGPPVVRSGRARAMRPRPAARADARSRPGSRSRARGPPCGLRRRRSSRASRARRARRRPRGTRAPAPRPAPGGPGRGDRCARRIPCSSMRPAVDRIDHTAHSTRSASGRSASSGSRSHHDGRDSSPSRTRLGWSSRHSSSWTSDESSCGPPPSIRSPRGSSSSGARAAARRRRRPVWPSSATIAATTRSSPAGSPRSRRRPTAARSMADASSGIGQVAALDSEPQRARRDRLAQAILGRRLAQVKDDAVTEAPRLAMDHVDQLEAGRDRRERAREKPLGVRAVEQERAPATRLQCPDRRCQAVTQGGGLGAGALGATTEDRLQAQRLRRLATEHPRRGQVLVRQLVDASR